MPTKPEVLVDGIRRGLTPRQRLLPKTRPLLSKAALFQLWLKLRPSVDRTTTYAEAKALVEEYKQAKEASVGTGRPFAGWQRSNCTGQLEQFSLES